MLQLVAKVVRRMRRYLYELRKQNKMTQQDVADRLKISRQYYGFVENGERKQEMSISMLCSFAEIFNTTVADLVEAERNFSAAR